MARRMFSDKIVDTDAFLDMGQGSQLLYFHLAMRADDDGFVANPKKVMRMIGSQEDDFKVLLGKRFIILFESGVCVIKHWLIHNLIRSDRYTETQWVKEKGQLFIDPETKKYSLNKGENIVIPNGNQMATQDRLELGKSKDRIEDIPFQSFWEIYPKKVGRKKCEEMWKNIDVEVQKLILEDIPLRMEDEKWKGGFIKDPERYLKHEQWNDEILKPKVAEKTKHTI